MQRYKSIKRYEFYLHIRLEHLSFVPATMPVDLSTPLLTQIESVEQQVHGNARSGGAFVRRVSQLERHVFGTMGNFNTYSWNCFVKLN